MPKQIQTETGVKVIFDEAEPKDKVKIKQKEHKGKDLKKLTQKDKAELFDLYVDAGVITH